MARRVIALLGTPIVLDGQDARAATEAITPGHLVALSAGAVAKNSAAAANVAPLFALERDEMGKDIDVAYVVDDQVKIGAFHQGQRVYAWLASGQNVADGAYLTTDTAGRLTAAGVTATIRRAQALESVDASAGDARIRVQVI